MPAASTSSRPDALEPVPTGFEPIHPAVLQRLDRWDVDLYVPGDKGQKPLLLCDASVSVDPQSVQRLVKNIDRRVLVKSQDYKALSTELFEIIDTLASDTSVPEAERFAMLQTAAAEEVQVAATLVDSTRMVSVSQRLGGNFVDLIESGELAPTEVYEVARHDHLTFAHVTNVCCYALVLADALGLSDRAELEEIAGGALLHDSGKRYVAPSILNKNGRLDDKERKVIESHPQKGYEDLVQRGVLTHAQLMMVYQHHEWINGGGYPVGVTAEDLHPWSKMLAVVDVFDALTGKRPYRKPMPPECALEFIIERAGTQFDEEIVECWKHAIART